MTDLHRIRTLIVDDEPVARRRIRALLAGEHDVDVIGEAANGTEAVKAIVGEKPELVFLDVQMPGLDGFEVIRATADQHRPFVVFVTAHDEHAIRAFEVQAVDYLLKPVVETRFRDAVRRVVGRIRDGAGGDLSRQMTQLLERVASQPARPGAGRIPVKRDGRVNFVRVEDIDWVEADGDFVKLHAGRETHMVRETMADIALKLPTERFARVHRGIIVNADRVKEIQPWFKGDYVLILHDGTRLRSGRTYRQTVQTLIG
jgi:two-component system, LytTR family, response regulator